MISSFEIENRQSIWDLIMEAYGTLDESVTFLEQNSALIPDIGTDLDLLIGDTVYYDTTLVVPAAAPAPVIAIPAPVNPIASYTGNAGQSMFGVCMNCYMTLEELVNLLNDNNTSLSGPVYGVPFIYDTTLIADENEWDEITGEGIVVN